MSAKLIYREKYIYSDGAIREMVLWQLPGKSADRPHGLKYRLYYGLDDEHVWYDLIMKPARAIINILPVRKKNISLLMWKR
jgi:hypothetical protein